MRSTKALRTFTQFLAGLDSNQSLEARLVHSAQHLVAVEHVDVSWGGGTVRCRQPGGLMEELSYSDDLSLQLSIQLLLNRCCVRDRWK